MTLAAAKELTLTFQAVALGKLMAFDDQCRRLAELVRHGVIEKADAVDILHEVDLANDLSATYEPLTQRILASAFSKDSASDTAEAA